MSRYCFIASDDNSLPEIDLHKPETSGRMIFNNEAELGDLYIKRVYAKKHMEMSNIIPIFL